MDTLNNTLIKEYSANQYKMSEIFEKIHNFLAKNYLINNYLTDLYNKTKFNQKPKLYEYLLIICFHSNILKFIYCLNKSQEIRLSLFDISLFFGGIQEYNSIILIIGCNVGALFYISFYMKCDYNLFKWTQIVDSINGQISPQSIDIYKHIYNSEDFQKLYLFEKLINKFANILYLILSEL